jgi:hypothetical protein
MSNLDPDSFTLRQVNGRMTEKGTLAVSGKRNASSMPGLLDF